MVVDKQNRFDTMAFMNKSPITVIDDKNLRGFVAPSSLVSKETLADVIDLVRYSNPKIVAKINRVFSVSKKFVDGRALRKQLGA